MPGRGVQLAFDDDPAPDGVQRAADGADSWWTSTALSAIKVLAEQGQPFEAYDVTLCGVVDPDAPCRCGPVLRAAHRSGLIQPYGFATARRPGRSGGLTRLWVGSR